MAGVPFDKIKGKTAKVKTKNLDKLFMSFLSYSGTRIRVNKKVKNLVVNFINEADLHKTIQQEITVSDTEKICCIKNPNNYKQLNYAYINFESDKDLATAAKTEYSYEGNGTAHGGSMHEPNNNHVSAEHIKMLKKLQNSFEELKKDIAIQAEVISNFDKKLVMLAGLSQSNSILKNNKKYSFIRNATKKKKKTNPQNKQLISSNTHSKANSWSGGSLHN
ncbi:10245_t:CDS:2, partial [Entrophospora sp. SA101]